VGLYVGLNDLSKPRRGGGCWIGWVLKKYVQLNLMKTLLKRIQLT